MAVQRVCFVGASNVEGVGDEERRGWAGRMTMMPPALGKPVNFYNLGIGGNTTDDIRARWKPECEARLPDGMAGAIVASFGLNDAAEVEGQGLRLPLAETVANVTAAAGEMRAWRPVIWVGPTPVDEAMMPMRRPGMAIRHENARLLELNATYQRIADSLDVPYMDLITPLLADARYMVSLRERDGLHPSGAGYAIIAGMTAAWPAWRALFD